MAADPHQAFKQQVLAWRLAGAALWLIITGTLAVVPCLAAGRGSLLHPWSSLRNLLSLKVWGGSLGLAVLAVLVQLAHLAALLATEPEPFRVRMPDWLIR